MVNSDGGSGEWFSILAPVGLYAIALIGMDALDSINDYRKERNIKKKEQNVNKEQEQNVKLKGLRETSQQREDHILEERESCFPLRPYGYSTPS
ncbi:hypothetical protein H5410_042088 [Solanum commersonii]|uniref:Uncharacterized protein n=1 Tax=Solanum commersonii TaxID=4109 RepID=A0A9J5XXG7_SOLCO|nr:hypothetical protein H5410_042088 [Solanum commersonii]